MGRESSRASVVSRARERGVVGEKVGRESGLMRRERGGSLARKSWVSGARESGWIYARLV